MTTSVTLPRERGAPTAARGGLTRARGAVAVLVGLVVVSTLWIYASVSELTDRGAQIQQRQEELLALRRRADGATGVGGANAGHGNPYLTGASLSLASNALQERVVRILEETGGNVVSVSVEPPSTQADPLGQRLVLQAMAEMTNDTLQVVLHRLESEAPALFVESLLVDRRTAGLAEPEGPGRPQRLRVDLRIAGYARVMKP